MRNLLLTLEKMFTHLAMLATFLMMMAMVLDAAGRYFLRSGGIAGIYEIVEQYLLPSVVFLGICYTYRGGGFIRISFLTDRLPRKMRVPLEYFDQFFSILLCLILLVTTGLKTLRIIRSGLKLENWGLPVWPAYLIAFIGFILAVTVMLYDLKFLKKEKSGLFSEESPTI